MHLKRVLDVVDNINGRSGRFISYGILLIMLVTVYEVVSRYAFNRPTIWAHETTQILFFVFVILASAFSMSSRATTKHIKMDIFYTKFSPRKKAIVELFVALAFFLFVGMALWCGWGMAWRSTQFAEHSQTTWAPPVYPIKWFLPLGLFLFLTQGVVRLARNIAVVTGRRIA